MLRMSLNSEIQLLAINLKDFLTAFNRIYWRCGTNISSLGFAPSPSPNPHEIYPEANYFA